MAAAHDIIRMGTVIEIDLPNAAVRVALGDIESDWIAWSAPRAGETRVWLPPAIGEQIIVACPDNDLEAGFILGSIFCDDHPAPSITNRTLILFKDGGIIAYDPEAHQLEAILPEGGTATITAPAGITLNAKSGLTINAQDGVTIHGDVAVTGKVTASDDVIGGGKSLKSHKHGGVQAGGALSGVPL